MPRIQRVEESNSQFSRSKLANELAAELRLNRPYGQPVIQEQIYQTGLIRVSVLWDRWEGVRDELRSKAIIGAYQIVEGREYAQKVRLTTGMTFPEAVNSGMLPYQILLVRRLGDSVTAVECRQAMIEEGASTLIDPLHPPLLFASEEEAEAARIRLVGRLPASEPVWHLTHLVGHWLELARDDEF